MSSCHPGAVCFHGKVMEPGRSNSKLFRCYDCEELAEELGCERSVEPYLFVIDPEEDESQWWLRYTKHAHVRDPQVTDRNICTICYLQNW